MIGKRMLGDIGERFLEIGETVAEQTKKQVVKGGIKSAKKQLVGDKKGKQDKGTDGKQATLRALKATEDTEGGDSKIQSLVEGTDKQASGKQQFTQMLGDLKKMTGPQLTQAKKQDDIIAQQQAAKVREHIRRYKEIQEAIKAYRAKKAKEIPAHVRGKPGEAATPEEQAEKMAKLKQLEEEKKKKKKPILPPSVSRLFGSRERGKFVVG